MILLLIREKRSLGIFLDIPKAFDYVFYTVILDKLKEEVGIFFFGFGLNIIFVIGNKQ